MSDSNEQVVETTDTERQQAVERLQVSMREHEGDLRHRGQEDGRRWATHDAEAAELQRLSQLREACAHEWVHHYEVDGSAYTPGEIFFFDVDPENKGDRQEPRDFWGAVLDDEIQLAEEPVFVSGFADGAIDFFKSVEDEL